MAFNKEKVMDAARKFVDKGQLDKAVKEYLRIVSEDPKDVRVWLKIGDLYAKKGAKQDATDTYLKVARFYHDQGFFLKAVAVYKQILKLDPRLVDVILKLAELYRQLGLMSDAMQHFESVAAHFHREGNTKEALATVKKLVDLDPENIATRIKLAELYSKEELLEDAAQEFTLACDQLRRQGRQDDFVKVAERLLWHKPNNHELNRELAGLYLRRNDPRRALQKLQACFKAEPRDVETLGLLAQAFQALDQKAKTVSVLKELARIHVENKHRDKAAEVYRKILEFVPNDPDAIAFMGPPAVAAPPVTASAPPIAPPRPPPNRATTPLPPEIRQALDKPGKFNLTGDMAALPPSTRMTGSMPLVDEQSLSGVDFALPEYDDSDFSADMEPPPDPRAVSAAGERHAEEISKILAETDVYVKYGLHQKAVDHLRRVFTLDEENVEAHERLKDIFVGQGREQEAEVELLKLAELVAPSDPDRAEAYLRELLGMNGTHTGAFELARRFRLRVARMSSASAEHGADLGDDSYDRESSDGAVAVIDSDRDAYGDEHDPIDDFDPDELIGHASHSNGGNGGIAHGSPAPARPPGPPPRGGAPAFETNEFELDFASSPSQATRQMSPGDAAELAMRDDEDLGLDAHGGHASPDGGFDPMSARGRRAYARVAALDEALEAQLDDATLGEDIDQEVAAELGAAHHAHDIYDAPDFDPDAARAFDAGVARPAPYVSGFEQTDLPASFDNATMQPGQDHTASYADLGHDDGHDDDGALSIAGSYDPYATGTNISAPAEPDNTSAVAVDTHGYPQEVDEDEPSQVIDRGPPPPDPGIHASTARSETSIEDDLDEADFYAGQGMYPEALDVLRGLQTRYPQHPLIRSKLRDLEALVSAEMPVHVDDQLEDPIEVDHAHAQSIDSVDGEVSDSDVVAVMPHLVAAHAHGVSDGTDALDLEEIEELDDIEDIDDSLDVNPDELADDDDLDARSMHGGAKQPQVLLENPVDEGDADTHYDLGLAYKEMGLYDEAVKAFDKTLRAHGREVQCRLMMGMCRREQGNPSEAIHQFKQGLHAEPSERERQSLYYEIALTYEAIGDDAESLYYFDMVLKRDPGFADAAERAEQLRHRVSSGRSAAANDDI